MRWPKISIVTPSYNQGKYIERTVRSVLLQRYPNLEYILMDGGSTDDTLVRLAPYRDQFSYFVSEPDKGQADAIANGFARSSGEIMAYLNSDDLLAPDALHFVANFFRDHPNIDWIYSHRCTVDDDDRVVWYWILPPHQNFLMRRWDYIPQETCFWRRSLFEKTGNIDRSYKFALDYDLFVRFMNLGHGRRLNRFLGAFRDHGTSKTKQLLETVGAREMLKVRRKFRIRAAPTDGMFGLLIGNWVTYAGRYFAAAAHSLPGGLPGVGYDYNEVWGGLLRRDEGPMEPAGPNHTHQEDGFYSPLCPVTLALADRLLFAITSCRGGHVMTNDIYLNSQSRVAIVAPPVDNKDQRRANNQFFGNQLIAGSVANASADPPRAVQRVVSTVLAAICRLPLFARRMNVAWEDRAAEQLLGLTRGLISTNDEIAFLDTGCSRGELLDVLSSRTKWRLSGLEANRSAVVEATSRGHHVFEATLREAPGIPEIAKGFDLIYLGQGIECFDDPRASLRTVAVLLNPGGLLVLSTPNLDSEQRKLFGPAWAHWKPAGHRFIFSKKGLTLLLAQTGFSLTKLTTISPPDSTALSLRQFNDRSGADSACTTNPKMLGRMQAEAIEGSCHLLWNRLGKGDLIFAICRRVF